MGHIIYDDELDTITFDDGEWVKIKRKMSYGDHERLQKEMFRLTINAKKIQEGENIDIGSINDIELRTGQLIMLEINIKEWGITGRNGVMPLIPESIAMLDQDTAELILSEIGQRNPPGKKAKKGR